MTKAKTVGAVRERERERESYILAKQAKGEMPLLIVEKKDRR